MHKRCGFVSSDEAVGAMPSRVKYATDTGTIRLSAYCLPCRVTILSHVDAASDGVALNDSFEGPRNVVSWNLHVAAKLNLAGVNRALEFCVVDFAVLHTGEFVAALLERELLFPDAAGVLNRDGPRALDRRGSSGGNHRIFVIAGFGEGFVDSVRDDSILAGIHHVRHDGDGAGHFVWALPHASVDNDAGGTGIEPGDEFCTGDLQDVGIPVDAQTRSLVGEILRFEVFEIGGRQRLDTGLNVFEPGAPLTL